MKTGNPRGFPVFSFIRYFYILSCDILEERDEEQERSAYPCARVSEAYGGKSKRRCAGIYRCAVYECGEKRTYAGRNIPWTALLTTMRNPSAA